jgi:hypothetical protein
MREHRFAIATAPDLAPSPRLQEPAP